MDAQGQLHCSDFNVHFYSDTIDRVKKHLLARSPPPPTGRLRVDVFVNAQTISLLSMKVCVRPHECLCLASHLRPRRSRVPHSRVYSRVPLAYGQALGSGVRRSLSRLPLKMLGRCRPRLASVASNRRRGRRRPLSSRLSRCATARTGCSSGSCRPMRRRRAGRSARARQRRPAQRCLDGWHSAARVH